MAANGRPLRETAVGGICFATLGLLGVFTILIGDIPIFKSTWTFDVLFDDVGGLERGQDVLYAGSKIGSIKEILTETEKIRVTLEISGPVVIYRDAEILIEEKSALGGMRVSMTRGTPKGGTIKRGEAMTGKGLSTLSSEIKEAARKVAKLSDAATEAIAAVNEGKGTIGKLWTQDDLYHDLKTAISDLKEIRRSVEHLLAAVRQNWNAEAKLILESTNREIGVGD